MSRALHIVIAGGNGQIGTLLARHFHPLEHRVIVLTRTAQPSPWQVAHWDGAVLGDWTAHLEHADVLINLAGRSVNCRYTDANRKAIQDSRVQAAWPHQC